MQEIWLRTNRRAIAAALFASAVPMAAGLLLWGLPASSAGWVRTLGMILAVGSASAIVELLRRLRRPRIARLGNELLFYLRAGRPLGVPLEFVEGFLLGQGPSYLPGGKPDASQSSTVVIRLADRATEFAKRDVRRSLGSWCNHYVTIRGTWCEPLSVALVTQLNQRLADARAQTTKEHSQR